MRNVMEKNALGHDKIARYGWRPTQVRGEYREINKRLLHVNSDYQRDDTKSKQLELASNWSWIACGTITVAERDGVYWVVDGQNRKLAADRRSDITALPCMVFEVEDVPAEARAFLVTNTNRKPVTALAKFKALLVAGDESARLVRDVIAANGLRLATASAAAGDFKAVAWALESAERDPDTFRTVMEIGGGLAVAAHGPLHHQIVRGLEYIHKATEWGLSDARLRARLFSVGITGLVRAANSASAYYAKGGAKVYAHGMMQAVNKGLHHKFEFGSEV